MATYSFVISEGEVLGVGVSVNASSLAIAKKAIIEFVFPDSKTKKGKCALSGAARLIGDHADLGKGTALLIYEMVRDDTKKKKGTRLCSGILFDDGDKVGKPEPMYSTYASDLGDAADTMATNADLKIIKKFSQRDGQMYKDRLVKDGKKTKRLRTWFDEKPKTLKTEKKAAKKKKKGKKSKKAKAKPAKKVVKKKATKKKSSKKAAKKAPPKKKKKKAAKKSKSKSKRRK